MNCPKCGTQNESENAFCVMCGAPLKAQQANTETNNNVNGAPVREPVVTNEAPVTPVVNTTPEPVAPTPVTPAAPVANPTPANNTNNQTMNNVKNVSYNAFKYILNTLKVPYKNYTRNEETLSNTKNSFILAVTMSVVMMLATLLATIIDTIMVKNIVLKE